MNAAMPRIPVLLADWNAAGITPPPPVPEVPPPAPQELPEPVTPVQDPPPMENPVPVREPPASHPIRA